MQGKNLLFFSMLLAGCYSPPPKSEDIRVPPVFSHSITVVEGDTVDFLAAGAIPDPEYAADRLNPDRYKKTEVSISCEGDCPAGLVINKDTAKAAWETNFEDAGIYRFFINAAIGQAFQRSDIQITVIDKDRPPFTVGDTQKISGSETDLIEVPINVSDLDGDAVEIECVECPERMTFSGTKLFWQTDYGDAGPRQVKIQLKSRPSDRKVLAAPDEEIKVIRRDEYLTTTIPLNIEITKKDRPARLESTLIGLTVPENTAASSQLYWSDADGDPAAFICIAPCPSFVTVSSAGLISVTPTYDDSGDYSVSVALIQNEKTVATALVGIKVTNVNRPPTYTGSGVTVAAKEGQISTYNFGVASDPDRQDRLKYSCVSGCPAGIFVTQEGQATYNPGFSDSGQKIFSIKAEDAQYSVIIPITINVAETNRAPFFNPIISKLEINALFLTKYRFYADDNDAEDRAKLRFTCVACPPGATLNALTGELAWTPESTQAGEHTLKLAVSDSRTIDPLNTTMDIGVTVRLVDRAPRFSSTASIIGVELSPVGVKSSTGEITNLRLQAFDPDGDAVTFSCASTLGTSSPAAVPGCPVGMHLNTATGEIAWTPISGQKGIYDVVFEAISYPNWSTAPADAKKAILNFKFIIKKFNRAPIVISNPEASYSVFEERHESASYTSPQTGPSISIALSASDPDGDTIFYDCLNCPAGMGIDHSTGAVSWTPTYAQALPLEAAYNGLLFFAADGDSDPFSGAPTRTFFDPVSILVHNVNRPPLLQVGPNQQYNVNEEGHTTTNYTSPKGAPLSLSVRASDPDGDNLTYACKSGCPVDMIINSTTGSVAWTPSYDYVRNAQSAASGNMVLQASDPDGLSVEFAPFEVMVANVNRPPVLSIPKLTYSAFEGGRTGLGAFIGGDWTDAPIGASIAFNLSATDPDGDPIIFSCSNNCPADLVLVNHTGEVFYTPEYCSADDNAKCQNNIPAKARQGARKNNQPYTDIKFTASDGEVSSESGAVTFIIKNYDRPPGFIDSGSSISVDEGGTYSKIISASDPDGDVVSINCDSLRGAVGGISPIYPANGLTGCGRTTSASYATADAIKYYWPTAGLSAPPFGQTIGLLSLTSPKYACVESDGATLKSQSNMITCELAGGNWIDMSGSTIIGVNSLGIKGQCQDPNLTTPSVGFCDAPTTSAPYIFRISAYSESGIEPGLAKNQLRDKSVFIRNVDRHTIGIDASTTITTGPIPEVGGYNKVSQTEQVGQVLLTGEQWPYQGLNLYDKDGQFACFGGSCPETAYGGTFRDGTYLYCDPTGPDGCPLGIEIKQFCDKTTSGGSVVEISGSCRYDMPIADQPGCSGNSNPISDAVFKNPQAKLSDLLWKRCADKGSIKFNKIFMGSAKLNNEPYIIRLKLRTGVHPDDFSNLDYPPAEESILLTVQITNKDRPPVFESSAGRICGDGEIGGVCTVPGSEMLKPSCEPGSQGTDCLSSFQPDIETLLPGFVGVNPSLLYVSEPAGNNLAPYKEDGSENWAVRPVGTLDTKSFKLSAFDRDSADIILDGKPDTEGVISYKLLGCRATKDAWGSTSPITPPPYKNEAPRWLNQYLKAEGKSTAPFFDEGSQSWLFRCPSWVAIDEALGYVTVTPNSYDLSMPMAANADQLCYANTRPNIGEYPYTAPKNANGTCPSGYTIGKTLRDFYAVFTTGSCPKAVVGGAPNDAWTNTCGKAGRSDTESSQVVKIEVLDSDRKPSPVTISVVKTNRQDRYSQGIGSGPDVLGVDIDEIIAATKNTGRRPFKLFEGTPIPDDIRMTEDRKDQAFWGISVTPESISDSDDSLFRKYNIVPSGVLSTGTQFVVSEGSWVDIRETDEYFVALQSSDPDGDNVYFDLESGSKSEELRGAITYEAIESVDTEGGVVRSGCSSDKVCTQILKIRPANRDSSSDRYMSTEHAHPTMPTPAKAYALAIRGCSAASSLYPDQKSNSLAASGVYGNLELPPGDKICSEDRNPVFSSDAARKPGFPDVALTSGGGNIIGQRWDGYVFLSSRVHDVDRLPVLSVSSDTTVVLSNGTVGGQSVIKENTASKNMCERLANEYASFSVQGPHERPQDDAVVLNPPIETYKISEYDLADLNGRLPTAGLGGAFVFTNRPAIVADLRLAGGAPLNSAGLEAYYENSPSVEADKDNHYSNRNRLRVASPVGFMASVTATIGVDNSAAPTALPGSEFHSETYDFNTPTKKSMVSSITYDSGYGAMTEKYTQLINIETTIAGQYVKPCVEWYAAPNYASALNPNSTYNINKIRHYLYGATSDESSRTRLSDACVQAALSRDLNQRIWQGENTTLEQCLNARPFGGGNSIIDIEQSALPPQLRSLSGHPWTRYVGRTIKGGDGLTLGVHEAADGIAFMITNAFFEYGGISSLNNPTVGLNRYFYSNDSLSDSSGQFILKYLEFKPMWSFNYMTDILGTRFAAVEMSSDPINGLQGGLYFETKPYSYTFAATPTITMNARDSIEANSIAAQTDLNIEIKDNYIKPHLVLANNVQMWAPFEACPPSGEISACASRPRFDTINSNWINAGGYNGGGGDNSEFIRKAFRSPNFKIGYSYGGNHSIISADTDSRISYYGAYKYYHNTDGVGHFSPGPDSIAVVGKGPNKRIDMGSMGPTRQGGTIEQIDVSEYLDRYGNLETNLIFGIVKRPNGYFLVPGVVNSISKEYTDGTERGLRRGLPTGGPSSPFANANEVYLRGYPGLRDHGSYSQYYPSYVQPYCENGQNAEIKQEWTYDENDVGHLNKYAQCPTGQKIYIWYTPDERGFQGGGGSSCSGLLCL